MSDFLGEYEVTVDAKGRLLLPALLRKQLPDGNKGSFVVNRGFEKCLTLYTIEVWKPVADKINKMNDLVKKVRDFKRLFMNGATPVELDTADRLLLPKQLLEYAGIKKDVVLAAQGNKIEIWDTETYHAHLRESYETFSALSDDIAGEFGNPFEL